ncbi:IS21-like element helper ATPase IstB [Youngiibacter fragilis]|uniref:ATPase AAA n=1 Tax=Youngiibacter fragilis 232.1 TaxID=994573 RepID=V7I9X5_9CLOT|nr:IS21-like element helper ATPase IstB [Youngiibacter fragilis]ETA82086.1 ATPase AAA [Youngiibacter fragilis 232.1]
MKNETIRKLRTMRLPAFAESYTNQIDNEVEYQPLSFHERLSLLVDAEYDSRHNNNILRLVKDAKFVNSSAYLGNVEYLPDRHLDRNLLQSLAGNEYIRQGINVLIVGATGSGKTYISNALGVNACQSGYKTRYIRLPELFSEFEAARLQGKYQQMLKQYQKYSLLILDEFLLIPSSESEQKDLYELLESRCEKSSTIVCSQFLPEGWHERLGGSVLAESILDRLTPNAHRLIIDGDVSMRQRKWRSQD